MNSIRHKPNIIIICTDQQRADLRKAEGFPCDTMPFLDQMAREGCDFRKAYTPAPICFPARNCLFTGRFASALHTTSNHSGRQDLLYRRDMLETLKEHGYKTALCGKNHSYVSNQAFDHCFQASHGGGRGPDRSEIDKKFDEYLSGLRHRTDFQPAPYGVEAQCPYRCVTSALNWIDTLDESPFFLWLSFPEPHNPYQVPEPYFSMFDDAPMPTTDATALSDKGFKYQWLRRAWGEVIENFDDNVVRTRKNYLGMLRLIDDQLSRFHKALGDRGLLDNTTIVFTTDHGDFVGEYGLIRKGAELAEPLCRIPFVVNGPGVRKGAVIEDAAVSLVDIFPTLCDLTGTGIPEGVQGRSLLPILTGQTYPAEEFASIYAEHGYGGHYFDGTEELTPEQEGAINNGCTFDCLNTWTQCGTARMVRQGDFKLVFDMIGNGQLYDISRDPLELENLYGKPEFAQVQAELHATMQKWQMRAADNAFYPIRRYRFKKHPRNYQWGVNDNEFRIIHPAAAE